MPHSAAMTAPLPGSDDKSKLQRRTQRQPSVSTGSVLEACPSTGGGALCVLCFEGAVRCRLYRKPPDREMSAYPVPGYAGGMEMSQQPQLAPQQQLGPPGYSAQGFPDAVPQMQQPGQGHPYGERESLMGKSAGHLPGTASNLTEFLDPQGKYKLVMKGAHVCVVSGGLCVHTHL